MRVREEQQGQASVEFVALVPLMGVLALGCWQGVVAGECWWLSGTSARAAARASAVGGDPQAAARAALPQGLRRRLTVEQRGDGRLVVRLGVPAVLGAGRLWTVATTVGGPGSPS